MPLFYGAPGPEELQAQLRKLKTKHCNVPSAQQFAQAEQLFIASLRAPHAETLSRRWAQLGFTYEPLTGNIWWLREAQPAGGGLYLFRRGSGWGLQVPHAFHDRHTDLLGFQFFLEAEFAAGAWNTAHRRAQTHPPGQQADVAHQPVSYFQAFHQAWVALFPERTMLQLHGFARDKRKTAAAQAADVILSAGHSQTPPFILPLQAGLIRETALRVSVFGRDVMELGGLTNTQSRHSRQYGARFIHMEMAGSTRTKLTTTPELRQALYRAWPITATIAP